MFYFLSKSKVTNFKIFSITYATSYNSKKGNKIIVNLMALRIMLLI